MLTCVQYLFGAKRLDIPTSFERYGWWDIENTSKKMRCTINSIDRKRQPVLKGTWKLLSNVFSVFVRSPFTYSNTHTISATVTKLMNKIVLKNMCEPRYSSTTNKLKGSLHSSHFRVSILLPLLETHFAFYPSRGSSSGQCNASTETEYHEGKVRLSRTTTHGTTVRSDA